MLRIHISNIEPSYSRLVPCFIFIYDILIIDLYINELIHLAKILSLLWYHTAWGTKVPFPTKIGRISERYLRYSRLTVADLESVIRESCLWGTNRRRFILSNNGQDGPFFSTGRGTSKTQTQAVKHQKIERECLYLNILKKVA